MSNEALVLRAEAAANNAAGYAEQTASDRAAVQTLVDKIDKEQLPAIAASKEAIRDAIETMGQECDETVPFAEYADKILSIETGVDVSDASVGVTAKDVRNGVKVYSGDSIMITGELESVTAARGDANTVVVPAGIVDSEQTVTVGTVYTGNNTITPGDTEIVVPADTFLQEALKIAAVSGGSDVVFGYLNSDGLLQPIDISGDTPTDSGEPYLVDLQLFKTGKPLPEYSTGSSMDFYKCASVDTSAKTWAGYKAVLTDGVYSFEESVTSGLTYTAITPVIDKIYTADALCAIKTLYTGFEPNTLMWTGDSLTSIGEYELSFTPVGDVTLDAPKKAFYLPGEDSAGFKVTLPSDIDLSSEFCIDFGAKITGSNSHMGFFRIGAWNIQVCSIHTNQGTLWGQPGSFGCQIQIPVGTWHHYVWQKKSDGTVQIYMDGVQYGETTTSNDYTGKELSLNASNGGFSTPFMGYIKNFRIGMFARDAEEIKTIAEEFNAEIDRSPVFYASLSEASSTAETGQALTTYGDVTYSTVDGVPCAVFDGSCYLYGTENLISGATPFSYSLWVKPQSTSAVQWFGSVGNTNSKGTCFLTGIRFAGKYSGGFYYYDNSESPVNADTSKWTHLLFTYDGATLKTYANGAWQHDFSVGAMNLQNGWTIGCMAGSRYDERMSGYVAAVRVYDRVVTAGEIQQLAGEFDV